MSIRLVVVSVACVLLGGCIGGTTGNTGSSDALRTYPLSTLDIAEIKANDQTLRVWLMRDDNQRQEGLMWVRDTEISDEQGMLFVFPDERVRGFWMKDTITPLDIAFARFDGEIVMTHQMPPLTLNTFPSVEPAMFALEMKAGAFEKLGIEVGDHLDIPASVLNGVK
ncbi:MAG: DUF192 domain-containing protein [Phycisphaerales bacterium]|nr:DUF192 domain-containing protein [Phycisphaerales bacterium]